MNESEDSSHSQGLGQKYENERTDMQNCTLFASEYNQSPIIMVTFGHGCTF